LKVEKLTGHFLRNWNFRVGGSPTLTLINEFIRHSVRIQRPRMLYESDGKAFPLLAMYWNPEMDIIITVDGYQRKAVSVLTPACLREAHEKSMHRMPAAKRGQKPPAVHGLR
jgi:hypothetical protein